MSTDVNGVQLLRALRTVIIACAITVSAAPGRPAVASPAQPTGQIALLGSGGGVNTYALAEMAIPSCSHSPPSHLSNQFRHDRDARHN